MNITPSIKEMETIGFILVPRTDGKVEIKSRSVSFIASESHNPFGKKTGEWHWAGYKDNYFVCGWSAKTTFDALNTLIMEERELAYQEGKKDLRKEIRDLLIVE